MKKILIIDDEPGILDVFREILQEDGYSVITAENGVKGLARMEEAAFDLVIVDRKMPFGDGPDFVERIRERKVPIKILLITGSPAEPLPAGIDGYLPKPCEVDELQKMVGKLLEC